MDVHRIVKRTAEGRIPAAVYSDPRIFELECERLFAHHWQFLAHESEVPNPGDYVTRRIVNDSFIVARDEDGEVRVLLNVCRHRGMQVCRAEAGNTSHFRCPYHAWTYRNNGQLVGIPFHADAYGGDRGLRRADFGLLAAPKMGIYRGLIFASLDASVPDLEDALGGFKFYLDLYINTSAEGVELRGPQRWLVRSNWKIGAENFSGDSYHTPHTHASALDIGLHTEHRAGKRKEGVLYWTDGGGGTTYKTPTSDFAQNLTHLGYPPEMIERMHAQWSPEQRRLVGERGFMVAASTIFPNTSLIQNWPHIRENGPMVPFTSLRTWQPTGPTETEIFSWFVVDKNAPDWYKEDSYKAYVLCFGSSGMFEQDDVENWTSITTMAGGQFGATVELHNSMGLAPGGGTINPPISDWPGPGVAYVGYGEYNQREFLSRWSNQLLSQPGATDKLYPYVNGNGATRPGTVTALGSR